MYCLCISGVCLSCLYDISERQLHNNNARVSSIQLHAHLVGNHLCNHFRSHGMGADIHDPNEQTSMMPGGAIRLGAENVGLNLGSLRETCVAGRRDHNALLHGAGESQSRGQRGAALQEAPHCCFCQESSHQSKTLAFVSLGCLAFGMNQEKSSSAKDYLLFAARTPQNLGI